MKIWQSHRFVGLSEVENMPCVLLWEAKVRCEIFAIVF